MRSSVQSEAKRSKINGEGKKEKMTCYDCINCDKCPTGLACSANPTCGMFKPKSRFVELPCEVGQTLYFLYDRASANKPDLTPRIYETKDWYFDIDKKGISILPRSVHGYKGKYHYYLNETVFLSREDAEKASQRKEDEGK